MKTNPINLSWLKIVNVLVLTTLVSFLVISIFFDFVANIPFLNQFWFLFGFQFVITLLLFEFSLWSFREKIAVLQVLRIFSIKKFLLGFILGLVGILASHWYSLLFDQKIFFAQNLSYLWLYALVFVFQTFVEELIYRGFLITEFAQIFKKNEVLSAGVSAVLFALVHIFSNTNLLDIFNLFLFGFCLGLIYIESEFIRFGKGLWLVSGFHAAWNIGYFGLGVQYGSQSSSESGLASYEFMHIFGGELSAIINKLSISLILILGIFLVLHKRHRKPFPNLS